MKAIDADPIQRWLSISEWYAEGAKEPGWEFLSPMVELTAWVAEQPFAAPLYPGTSHDLLCVDLHSGYDSDRPFFSCGVGTDRQFVCEMWKAVGRRQYRRVVPIEQAREAFREFVHFLCGTGSE